MFITGVVLIGIALLCLLVIRLIIGAVKISFTKIPLSLIVFNWLESILTVVALVNLILVYFVNF